MKTPIAGERYTVEREVAQGGGGIVYVARDRLLQNRQVALKVVPLQQATALAAGLKNEFALLTSLRHQHLARVHDFGVDEQAVYITSEWIEGQNLLDACRNANLNTVLQLLVQTLRAVDYLHRRGVLHLDLKPDNILVSHPDQSGAACVKLIDFGLSEWRRKDIHTADEFSGTVPFAAPELMMGQAATPATDLYALGMIFHQIFAGRFPFASTDPLEMMKQQIYGEALPLEDLPPALPESFSQLLYQSVSRDPNQRFQSARDLLHAINTNLDENFTLRSPTAPARILEESDYCFRAELVTDLVASLQNTTQALMVQGDAGSGKTRLLQHLKERLQLAGVHTLLFETPDTWREYIESTDPEERAPMLLDFTDAVSQAESLRVPANTIVLESLSDTDVFTFLAQEVLDFPLTEQGDTLIKLIAGSPYKLETLLQALREAHWIQWSQQGWHWVAEENTLSAALLQQHEDLWNTRKHEVQQILAMPLALTEGLSAAVLEGLLGVETGVLNDKLTAWTQAGILKCLAHNGQQHYKLSASAPKQSTPMLPEAWEQLTQQLSELYEQGKFESGSQWAETLVTRYDADQIPEAVALRCIRHLLASNRIDTATQLLPTQVPTDTALQGLFYELQGRIQEAQGDIDEAFQAYQSAQQAYATQQDLSGVARSLNLQGLYYKKAADFKAAEAALQEAATTAQQVPYPYLAGLAVMNRATLYHDQGNFDQAAQTYTEALEAAARAEHPLLECLIYHNQVNLLYHTGRTREAETSCYDWLHLALESQFTEQQAAALNYLALLAAQQDARRQQSQHLNRAINLLASHESSPLLPQLLINRGYLAWKQQRFLPAQIDGERGLELAERGAINMLAATARLLLGKVLRDRPQPDLNEAASLLHQAYQTADAHQNRQILWECRLEQGLVAKKQGDPQQARHYLQAAQEQLQSLIKTMPTDLQKSFLRDRKLENIAAELDAIAEEP